MRLYCERALSRRPILVSITNGKTKGKRDFMTTATEKRSTPASTTSESLRPMTGEEYIESIRDGREVFLYGDRVKDVTTHPAFRNSVRMTARLYYALHNPKTRDMLTCPTDTGSGGYTMRFFRSARSEKDLVCDRDAIASWARLAGSGPPLLAAWIRAG